MVYQISLFIYYEIDSYLKLIIKSIILLANNENFSRKICSLSITLAGNFNKYA